MRLHGWWFHASDPNAPVIVWCHGNAGNITNRADTAAELARRIVLYGESVGGPYAAGHCEIPFADASRYYEAVTRAASR